MGDSEESLGQEVATLRQEVIRLTQELDQTSSEKIQSAQYGLVLLEEQENLEARCQVCKRSDPNVWKIKKFVLN